ncbi:MAG TPA: alkyl sulfatase dimerization domain-containing protein [Amaricoccus sp.]|uniref:alkyl/aryl-sulfatase n=1 Tax=Amaricoccus sp. TaxID=1872485 RepID=UPI002C1E78D0|nr:alkyl sulfatase dimerization domain-containing protein [Amaricoccus sp.]HMQ91560.1 alkyl sulfatase dimerization domain-containing protein [Amaricoccus sp.]HMR50979.1 alkyl sulfatase dimerization domain-containing protein [Amaricoccus sp.]HMR59829.1 alkyl sulfatase dimerization domain-containing protein [Amaricoccus sp.]HMT97842.1 alkyl sulfatase dimerization domain-containing protein [Amaricoccus sp.]
MTTRREFLGSVPAMGAAFAIAGDTLIEGGGAVRAQQAPLAGHFHPKGKAPSDHTRAVLEAAKSQLPFADTRDFEEQAKGLIAPMTEMVIPADAGHVAWDMASFQFLDQQAEFDSIHPSLHRISKLNNNYGLYEVIPGIYQVRGFDLSDLTFIRGKTGWIVFDPLVSSETARAAWKLFQAHRGEGLPVSAVIYSHTHGDHWGGVRGILDEADVRSGKVEVIAPVDFLGFTVSENVYAGNAMNRRLFYQYGLLLPAAPHGYVGQGLGTRVSAGATGLIAPTRLVREPIEEFEVDGLRMVFHNTPNTEAPREMNTWIPEMKALWMAENVTATLHNIYTLRGAQVRDPLAWSKYIADALYRFGLEAEVMFASHHWPRWGNDRIQEVLRAQRDLYANMNNQVLHLANQGVTINQVHNVYEVPAGLQQQWHCRGYHGSPEHNARGVIQRYLGFWDCNPATLIPLSPEESAPLYVEMMGGPDRILARGRELHDAGDYLLASEIVNKLVQAEPDNAEAKDLLADIFEQIGYQQENPGLRNSFLAGAYELRTGIPEGETADSSSPDVIRAMSTELFLNFLGIRMDSRKAEGLRFTINLVTPDTGETFLIEMENATLTNIAGFQAAQPDLTLTIDRTDLEQTMMGAKTLDAQIADGTARIEGDPSVLGKLAATMVDFDPRFEIMPGTKAQPAIVARANPYEAVPERIIAE